MNAPAKKYYKLTTQSLTTYNNTQWEVGEWKETSGEGAMCGPGWLHCYDDPRLAVLLNPVHANFEDPILWEIEVGGMFRSDGRKCAWTRQRLVKQIPLPTIDYLEFIRTLVTKHTTSDFFKSWVLGDDHSNAIYIANVFRLGTFERAVARFFQLRNEGRCVKLVVALIAQHSNYTRSALDDMGENPAWENHL